MIRIIKYGLASLIWLLGQTLFAYTGEDCIRCHKTGSWESRLQISLEGYESSVHGEELACKYCHSGITDEGHKTREGSGRVDCGQCHEQQDRQRGFLPGLVSLQAKTHGKQDFSRDYDRGDCLGCHQGRAAHGEKTAINDRNCHKCHMPPDDQDPLLGSIHPVSGTGKGISTRIAWAINGSAVILALLSGLVFCIVGLLRKGRGD
ncbi:cytochrome c3 family protein [Thermodesulfobacteriota bacterium]